MFLAVSTRPDIVYSINFLSQFHNNYNVEHWKAVKRVMLSKRNYGMRTRVREDWFITIWCC